MKKKEKIEEIRLVEVVFRSEGKKLRIDLLGRRSWGRIVLIVLSVLLLAEERNRMIVVEL
jgi:hypothetical protein